MNAETAAKISATLKGRRKPPRTEAHRAALSAAASNGKSHRCGTTHTPETREKMSEAQRGERGSGWKGGVSTLNERARRRVAQKAWRVDVFERDDYTCQECGQRGGNLHAHHILAFATHPEFRTALENGLTLCDSCHKVEHRKSA